MVIGCDSYPQCSWIKSKNLPSFTTIFSGTDGSVESVGVDHVLIIGLNLRVNDC